MNNEDKKNYCCLLYQFLKGVSDLASDSRPRQCHVDAFRHSKSVKCRENNRPLLLDRCRAEMYNRTTPGSAAGHRAKIVR